MDTLLHFPGSLLSGHDMVASYDIEQGCAYPSLSPLIHAAVLNYAHQPFQLDFSTVRTLTLVNAMGVTLGDSVIGIEVLHYLRQRHPGLRVRVLRPSRCADFVEQLYRLALDSGIIDALACLPQPLPETAPHDVYIDMGNQLFRTDFATLNMHDFFYRHTGIDEQRVADTAKQNRWLRRIDTRACERLAPDYVLFCPGASTALRAIPQRFHQTLVERLHQRSGLPVLGFGNVDHPHYRNIAHRCRDTLSFIAAIARARWLYAADSSALHIAAGFGVPTRALFSAIPPALRARYYPACDSVWTGTQATEALHQSSDPRTLRAVAENIARLMQNGGL